MVATNSLPTEAQGHFPHILENKDKLYLVSRRRDISNKIAFRSYQNDNIGSVIDDISHISTWLNEPIVLAMDLETFGEHNKNYFPFLFDILNHNKIETITFDDIDLSRSQQVSDIKPSSWSTEDIHISKENYFPLWDDPYNPLHTIMHTHLDLLINTVNGRSDPEILKAMHSCQFFWADGNSGRWSPEMIRKGMEFQRKVLFNNSDQEIVRELSDDMMVRFDRKLKSMSQIM